MRDASRSSRVMRRLPLVRWGGVAAECLEGRRLLSAAQSYVPGELLVSFEPGVSAADVASFYREHGFAERESLGRHLPGIDGRLKRVSVPAAGATAISQLVRGLERDPRVQYAQTNRIMRVASVPNDPDLGRDWGLVNAGQTGGTPDADIDADEAWDAHTGGEVVVGVLDTGIDVTHPDLIDNLWTNPAEATGVAGVDDDGNGFVDDVHGYDFAEGDADATDDYVHGTHVAGTIGMVGDNALGSAGVNWHVKVMNLKAGGADGGLEEAAIVGAYDYALMMKDRGVNIRLTNNSWRGYWDESQDSHAVKNAVDAMGDAGMLFIGAAGNETLDNDVELAYPASFDSPHIISVAASDHRDRISHFSNWGATTVDLAAPGVDVWSTVPGGGYASFEGTSMAAPHVAGAAALVWSAFPELTAGEVKARLLNGVDPIGHIGPNSARPTVTNGRLNVRNALMVPGPDAGDGTAPDALTVLAVSGAPSPWSLALNWTATGDDGATGRAGFYDVRYSSAPITEAKWAAASRLPGEPVPAAAGTPESFTAEGLEPGTLYYFAVKVKDNTGNESALSNLATGLTPAARYALNEDAERRSDTWTATGLWNRSRHRAYASDTAWYYGNDRTETYDTGDRTAGELTLKAPLNLTGVSQAILRFNEFRMPSMAPAAESALVQVSADGVDWKTIIDLHYPLFGWEQHTADLSAYAGGPLHLRFAFDSNDADFAPDAIFNDFEGWVIDNLQVLVPSAVAAPAGFAINDVTVTEGHRGDALATFTVTRPNGAGRASVEYETDDDGSADDGADYRAASGTLTFAAGETAKTVTVRVHGDRLAEGGDERFVVRLEKPRGAAIADGEGAATIVDDEPWFWMFTPIGLDEAGDAGVTTSFEFQVFLTLPSTTPVTVRYVTADGTAKSGKDYVPVNRKLTFAPGEMVQYVSFDLLGDTKPEAPEKYFIRNTSVTDNVSMLRQGVVYVFDDDQAPARPGTDGAAASAARTTFTPSRTAAHQRPSAWALLHDADSDEDDADLLS
jgi:subtilisin family serine protease